jgi:hypothetical protein
VTKRGMSSGMSARPAAVVAAITRTCGRAWQTSSRSKGSSSMKATASSPTLSLLAMAATDDDLAPQPIWG